MLTLHGCPYFACTLHAEARAAVLIKDLLCVEQQLIEPALAAGTILSVSEISIVDEAVDEGFFPLNDQKGEPPADLVQVKMA